MKFAFLATFLIGGLFAEEGPVVVRGHVFAWPFLELKEMKPRGGSTQGAEVTWRPQRPISRELLQK